MLLLWMTRPSLKLLLCSLAAMVMLRAAWAVRAPVAMTVAAGRQ